MHAEEFTKAMMTMTDSKESTYNSTVYLMTEQSRKGSSTYMQHLMMLNQRALTKEWKYSMKKCY